MTQPEMSLACEMLGTTKMEPAEQVVGKPFGILRGIPHPVILQQVFALQPKLAILLLCLFVPTWLPTMVSHGLLLWPLFSSLVSQHDSGYRIIFFLVQFSLTCGVIAFLGGTYRSAVWMPPPSWRRAIPISLITLLPLLVFHLFSSARGIRAIVTVSSFGIEGTQALASFHHRVWGQLAYGSSATGVLCSSLLSFMMPVLEEIVFAGFVVNTIGKRYGFVAAALGAPACFAIGHAIQFGIGAHLIFLFFAGMTYTMIRILSGSLLLAVFAHCIINAVIFLPKWVLAVTHFTHA